MSYTARDALSDAFEGDSETRYRLWEGLVERGWAMIRKREWDALVAFAESHGLDPDDESLWATDDNLDDVLLAIVDWRKEHIEWEPEV